MRLIFDQLLVTFDQLYMLLFRSVAFDIRSVVCLIFDQLCLIFDQLLVTFDQLYMLLFRSVAFDIQSVVCLIFDQLYV